MSFESNLNLPSSSGWTGADSNSTTTNTASLAGKRPVRKTDSKKRKADSPHSSLEPHEDLKRLGNQKLSSRESSLSKPGSFQRTVITIPASLLRNAQSRSADETVSTTPALVAQSTGSTSSVTRSAEGKTEAKTADDEMPFDAFIALITEDSPLKGTSTKARVEYLRKICEDDSNAIAPGHSHCGLWLKPDSGPWLNLDIYQGPYRSTSIHASGVVGAESEDYHFIEVSELFEGEIKERPRPIIEMRFDKEGAVAEWLWIRKGPTYSGTFATDLATKLSKFLLLEDVLLHDASEVPRPGAAKKKGRNKEESEKMFLNRIMTFTRGDSWYASKGFYPATFSGLPYPSADGKKVEAVWNQNGEEYYAAAIVLRNTSLSVFHNEVFKGWAKDQKRLEAIYNRHICSTEPITSTDMKLCEFVNQLFTKYRQTPFISAGPAKTGRGRPPKNPSVKPAQIHKDFWYIYDNMMTPWNANGSLMSEAAKTHVRALSVLDATHIWRANMLAPDDSPSYAKAEQLAVNTAVLRASHAHERHHSSKFMF